MQTNKLFAAHGDFFDVGLEITILAAPLSYLFDPIHRNVDCPGLSVDLGSQKMGGVLGAFSRTPAVRVEGANRHDSKLVKATLKSIAIKRPKTNKRKRQGMCLDRGYDYDSVRDLVKEFGYTAHIKTRGEEAQAIKRQAGFKARRWVVERTIAWLNRCRRLAKDWENLNRNALAFLKLASIRLMLRKLCNPS